MGTIGAIFFGTLAFCFAIIIVVVSVAAFSKVAGGLQAFIHADPLKGFGGMFILCSGMMYMGVKIIKDRPSWGGSSFETGSMTIVSYMSGISLLLGVIYITIGVFLDYLAWKKEKNKKPCK